MIELNLAHVFALTIKIYALMTPPAVLSAFISHTRGKTKLEKYGISCKCALAIFIIGELLFLFGAKIFSIFGFTLDAFRIGVGLLLFLTAIRLMNDDETKTHIPKNGDISVVPLALPLGMGPSAIGAVMVLGASAKGLEPIATGTLAIFAASMGMAVLLCLADPVQKLIGKTGIAVLAKLTALLLSAIAAQVIFTGIKAFLGNQ